MENLGEKMKQPTWEIVDRGIKNALILGIGVGFILGAIAGMYFIMWTIS